MFAFSSTVYVRFFKITDFQIWRSVYGKNETITGDTSHEAQRCIWYTRLIMKLAFCIFKYFPYGGLQRDCLRILNKAIQHGHTIDIYATQWQGQPPTAARLHILPITGWTNHTRMMHFARKLKTIMPPKHYDVIIGFNKLPNLDFYFAGDVCLDHKLRTQKPFFYRWLPRYRRLLQLEKSVFLPSSKTHIWALTQAQQTHYTSSYHTPSHRFHLLPPGVPPNTLNTQKMQQIRNTTRKTLGITSDHILLLFVATKFHNKGLDRAIAALSHLRNPNVRLYVVGGDTPTPYQKLAKRYHVGQQIIFAGAKPSVTSELLAADILIHPARVEAAGMILIEAIVMGLPVLVTDHCGYATHVQKAQAGQVVPTSDINHSLSHMLDAKKRKFWHDNALAYAAKTDLYHMAEKAVHLFEEK